MDTIKVQAQIRQNAEEISSFLADMSKWENSVKEKDSRLKKGNLSSSKNSLPVRDGSGTVQVRLKNTTTSEGTDLSQLSDPTTSLTPATLIERSISDYKVPSASIPKARGVINTKDAEESERERGNLDYESGNFIAAVKSYTKCLGLKVIHSIICLQLHFISHILIL